MSSHSQFKRFNILQQLEQAIKKKTHQKYKSKSKSKPIELKPARTPVLEKQSIGVTLTRKSNQGVTIPPQQPQTVKSRQIDFKVKKYQNKKFDKIVSLINYTITSADKALKYVSVSSNFEAEFAYKLYLSDRENLMNELNNLNLQQILNGINPVNSSMQPMELKALQSNQISNIEIHSLKNENDKLKKEIMIMEGEIKKYKHREYEAKSNVSSPVMGKAELQKEDLLKRQIDVKQIHINKLSDLLKRLCNFGEVYDYVDLVDKEMKYRSALASAGLSGFELSKVQRDQFERNLVSLDARIGQLEGLMIGKMEKMAEGEDEQVLQQLEAINKLLHKRIAPILKENQSQSLQNKKISQIIAMYVSYSIKKQKDLSTSLQKIEGKLIDYIQACKDYEKKDNSNEQRFDQLMKENELIKTNLKDIYDELNTLLSQSLRRNGISQSQDVTFETLLKHIEFTLVKNAELKTVEKKFKQLSEEDNRKSALINKQNSIIESMEYELNEMKVHLKDSEDRKNEVEEYVLLLQKKKKEQSKEFDELRAKFESYAKEMEDSETLLYEKEALIKRLEEEMEYTKLDIHKLSAVIRTKDELIHQREDIIQQRQSRIEKLTAQNSMHRQQTHELKISLEQEIHEKNKILQHMRFLEDRLKEAENHIEALGQESNEKVRELNQELRNVTAAMKESVKQREHFEVMYKNLLEVRESQDQRKMGAQQQLQEELQELRHQNQSLIQENQSLSQKLTIQASKSHQSQQHLISLHEEQKQQLFQQINHLNQQISQLKYQNEQYHSENQMTLMQQNISSQEDIVEDINNKEEQIILLKRTVQELEGELEERQNTIDELQARVLSYKTQRNQVEDSLQNALKEAYESKARQAVLEQQLQRLNNQTADRSPQKSHNQSLAYEQELKIQQMEQQLTEAYNELHNRTEEVKGLKNQLSSKEEQFVQLKEKMTHVERLIEEKETQMESRETELEAKEAELETKETELEAKFSQLEQRFNHLQERESQIQRKEEQLEAKYNDLQLRTRTHEQKQTHFHKISSQHDQKTQLLTIKQTQLSQRQQNLQQHQIQLSFKQEQFEQKEKELDSRLSELQQRQNQLEERHARLEERETEIQEKQSKLQYKESELEEKQQEAMLNAKKMKENEQENEQEEDQEKEDFQERCRELEALVQRYNQELQERDQLLLQNHSQITSLNQQITSLNEQINSLNVQVTVLTQELTQTNDTLTAERTASQSLSFHVSSYQQTIHQLQDKLKALEVTHEQKTLEIQSLNQKVEELYVEIVDLRRKQNQKEREPRSDELLKSIEISIKEQRIGASPIVRLEGLSPEKIRTSVSNYDGELEQVEEAPHRLQEGNQQQQDNPSQDQQAQPNNDSDLLKQQSNSVSNKKSDTWLSPQQVQRHIAQTSQINQVTNLHSQQLQQQYQTSTIQIIETKYKRIITELKQQVEEKEESISQVRQSHQLLENQNHQLIQHIQLIERTKIQLENQLESLREIAKSRMEHNDMLNDQLQNVKEQAETNTKKLVKEIQEYEELHLAPLNYKLQDKDNEIENLMEKYHELENTLQQTKRTKEEYIEALENQSHHKEEEFHKRLHDMIQQMDQEKLTVIKLQQSQDSLIAQNTTLKHTLLQLQKQSSNTNQKQIDSLKIELTILQNQSQLLQTKFSTNELKSEVKIREFQVKTQQLRGQIMKLTTEARIKTDQIQCLKKELEDKEFNFKSQSSSIMVKSSEEIDGLKRDVEELEDKLTRTEIMMEQAERKIAILQEQLNHTSMALTQKTTQFIKLQSEAQQLHKRNQWLQEAHEQLNLSLKEKQQLIEHLKLSQAMIPVGKTTEQPSQQNQEQESGNNLEEFDDMRSERMNESMMSNEPESEIVSKRVNEENEVHEARFENFLAKNLPTPSYHHQEQTQSYHQVSSTHQVQSHYQTITKTTTYQVYEEQEEHQQSSQVSEHNQQALQQTEQLPAKQPKEFFDQFDDMRSQKMNESMVSNDATQQRGDYYQKQADIVQDNYLTQNINETPQTQQETLHVEHETHQYESKQHEQNNQGQDFDEFNDMKSEQMNASMMSNQPEPTDTRQEDNELQEDKDASYEKDQKEDQDIVRKLASGHNIVDPHEEREHSEGSYQNINFIKTTTQRDQDECNLTEPQQHHAIVKVEHFQQNEEQQDLDQFNDMQSEKMNESMMSNQPEPTEHQEILTEYRQATHQQHENLVDLHEDKERSEEEVEHHEEEDQQMKAAEKLHFKSQQESPVHVSEQLQEKHEDQGQQFDEFNDMKSEQMNASMMSNQEEPTETQPLSSPVKIVDHQNIVDANEQEPHSEGSEVHQYQIKKSSQQEFDIEPQEQQEEVKKQAYSQQVLHQHHGEQTPQEEEQDFNQFDDMKSYKMNASMISNQPEPSEHPDYVYQKVESPAKNIVKANEEVQHSAGEKEDAVEDEDIYHVQDQQKEHPKSVQQVLVTNAQFEEKEEEDVENKNAGEREDEQQEEDQKGETNEYQQEEQTQEQPDFDEFNDMKSQKMNASMISNDAQLHQQHQQHQQLHQQQPSPQKQEDQDFDDFNDMKSQQMNASMLSNQPHVEQPEQSTPHKEQEQDLEDFNDMKSEKMNESMMSNEPQPTENQKYQHDYELQSSNKQQQTQKSQSFNLVSAEISRTPRSQYNYPLESQASEVVIHKTLAVSEMPEDEQIQNFNQIAEDRMNESMMSNEAEVSEKMNLHHDEQDDPQLLQHKSKIFEHNLVTVSRTSDARNQDNEGYMHDGRSQRGNLPNTKQEFYEEEEQDIVDLEPKKKSIIQTQYHHYRSEYEFGSSPFGESKDEDGLEDYRKVGGTKQFNGSIASNQVEVNDIGGNFINVYALESGKNNKVDRNIILVERELEERSETNLELNHQPLEKETEKEQVYHHKVHSSSRSEYAYNHSTQKQNKVESEGKEQSDSMVEDKDEEDEERDEEILEQNADVEVQEQVQEEVNVKVYEEEMVNEKTEEKVKNQQEKVQNQQENEQQNKEQSSQESEADQQQYEHDNEIQHHINNQLVDQQQPTQHQTEQPQHVDEPCEEPSEQPTQQLKSSPHKSLGQRHQQQHEQVQDYNHQQMQDYEEEGLGSSRIQKEADELGDEDGENDENINQREVDMSGQENYRGRNSLPLNNYQNLDAYQLETQHQNAYELEKDQQEEQQEEKHEQEQEQQEKELEEQEQLQHEDEQQQKDYGQQEKTQVVVQSIPITSPSPQLHVQYHSTTLYTEHQTITTTEEYNCVETYYQELTHNIQTNLAENIETLEQQEEKYVESADQQTMQSNQQSNSQSLHQYVSTSSHFVVETKVSHANDEQAENDEQKDNEKVQMARDRVSLLHQNQQEQEDDQDQYLNDDEQYYEYPSIQQSAPVETQVVQTFMLQLTHSITTYNQQQLTQTQTQVHASYVVENQKLSQQNQNQQQEEQKQYEQLEEEQDDNQFKNQQLSDKEEQHEQHKQEKQQREQEQQEQDLQQEKDDELQDQQEEREQHQGQSVQNQDSPSKQHNQNDLSNNFSDFNQMKSEHMNASMISNNQEQQSLIHQVQNEEPHHEQQEQEQKTRQEEVQKQQENDEKQENDELQENDGQQQGPKEQDQQEVQEGNGFDAFNDMASEKMNASMISNNNEQLNPTYQQEDQKEEEKEQTNQELKTEANQQKEQNNQLKTQVNQYLTQLEQQLETQVQQQFQQLLHKQDKPQAENQLEGQNEEETHKQQQLHHQQEQQIDGNDFDAFNDMKSEKMDASMMSNYNNEQLQEPNQEVKEQSLPQVQHQQHEEPVQEENDQNNFSAFNDMASEKMGQSMISNQSQQEIDFKEQLAQDINQENILKVEQDSHYAEEAAHQVDEAQQKEDENNFSNFNQMPSENMGDSMMSNQENELQTSLNPPETHILQDSPEKIVAKEQHQEETPQSKQQDINLDELEENKSGNEENQNNFSDFKEMENEEMSASMISNQQAQTHTQVIETEKVVESVQVETHQQKTTELQLNQDQFDPNNFSDFNDMVSQKMGDSMISNTENYKMEPEHNQDRQVSPIKEKSPENQQIQQSGNDFDAFNSMVEEKMDGSMMSNNNEIKNNNNEVDWFGNQNGNNQENNQKVQEQGFSDFKEYNSEQMSQSQVSASEIKPANFQSEDIKLHNLRQKQELLDDLLGMEKVLPSDILLTSERKHQTHEEIYNDDEEQHFNALINFLPQSEQKKNKPPTQQHQQATEEQGIETNRSNSFNQDGFEFQVRKSVQSISSRADIFQNFENPTGSKLSKLSSDDQFKSSEMVKSAKKIQIMKGNSSDLFGFEDITEQENESSQHSSSHHMQGDDGFADFLNKGTQPAPSPVHRKPEEEVKDFFDFDQAVRKSPGKKSEDKFSPFDDFE